MTFTITREFFIPAADLGAEIKVDGSAIVYTWSEDAKILAKGFSGKRAKSDFYLQFSTIERRDVYVAKWFADRKAAEEGIASRKAAKAADRAGLNALVDLPVGTILVESGGYGQTNVTFFKVVGHKGRLTVQVVEVGSKTVSGEGGTAMSDYVAADLNHCGEKITSHRQIAKDAVKGGYHNLYRWDGRPQYRSWYA